MRTALAFLALLVSVVLPAPPALGQEAAPPRTDTASYDIQARLDPISHQVHGTATIVYLNPSPDVLPELWFKLYLNAFRSPDTLWMREARGDGDAGYDPAHPGWIRVERLTLVDTGEEILPADVAGAETVLRVPLPRPLGPGRAVRLGVAWTSQLPRLFDRTGFADDFVMAGQWYPKLAVYDRGRWDAEPWHANAEFFADFGTYTLALTVPRAYVTGGSGVREGTVENGDGTVTVRYRAESVSDVAWTAWPGYRVVARTVEVAGRQVELELLTVPELADADERYFGAAEAALDLLGRWFGPYPWPRLTMVVPPTTASEAGGMEYPMLVTLSAPIQLPLGIGAGIRELEVLTVHEIAHQWIPLQVATDEAREAWLDEGFADYATIRVLAALFGADDSLLDVGPFKLGYASLHRLDYALVAPREPLVRPSWEYAGRFVYGATVYSKGALTLQTLERTLGEERFLPAYRFFFDRWRWRHPITADLQAAIEDGTGEPLDWLFGPLVYGTGVVEYRLAAVDERLAVVERRGDVAFPVRVRLTYEDGRIQDEGWDGAAPRLELAAPDGRIARAEVDPDGRVALELNRLDNALVVAPAIDPALGTAGRLLGLAQLALHVLGQVG